MKCMLYAVILATLLLGGCDKGLAPPEEIGLEKVTGISGTIIFQNWPPPDSVKELRLVAFRNFPPANIFQELLLGQAFAYPAIDDDSTKIPLFVDQYEFKWVNGLPAGTYGYLVVAQRYGDNLFADWRAVGQYDLDTDSLPSPITVPEGQLVRNIFIGVDFKNLPIQPF